MVPQVGGCGWLNIKLETGWVDGWVHVSVGVDAGAVCWRQDGEVVLVHWGIGGMLGCGGQWNSAGCWGPSIK